MNISRENATQHNAYIKIELEPADYQTAVADELKAYRKKVQLNGFRADMVPAGLVKKMYGKAILAEEVNKIISNKLQQYIADEKLEILGQPISAKDEETVADFENPDKFVFWFEIGLAPEFASQPQCHNTCQMPFKTRLKPHTGNFLYSAWK